MTCFLAAETCERQTLFGYHAGDNYYDSTTVDMQSACVEFCKQNFCQIVASLPLQEGGFECRLYRKDEISELIPSPGVWFQTFECVKGRIQQYLQIMSNLSHVTRKTVFRALRPSKTQNGWLSYSD